MPLTSDPPAASTPRIPITSSQTSLTFNCRADGRAIAEEVAANLLADECDLGVLALVARVEETPLGHAHRGRLGIARRQAVYASLRLRAGRQDLVRLHLHARQHELHARHRLGDGLTIAQRDTERLLAQILTLLRLHDLGPVLARCFEARGAGQLAVISSVAGDRGRQSNYVYGAAKGMVSLFLQGLRNRLFASGVHVLTIKPGFVDTPMTAHIKKGGPLWASPEQVAKGIVWAIDRRRDVAYVPGFWRPIMAVIRALPESVFKRLHL